MKKIGLRGALKHLGCRDIKLEWNGGVACRDQSGFFTGGGTHGFADGQTYYITYSPFHHGYWNEVMFRTALDRKDYSGKGGNNQWCFNTILNRIGYELDGKALMPRGE